MASGNVGKIREMARLLGELQIVVLPQSELGVSDVEETGTTFAENALQKARHAAAATGLPTVADDSGLMVDALGGRPGIFSARYAGTPADAQANIDKLLHELDDVPDEQRGAVFHCTACFVMPNESEPLFATGSWHGVILHQRRGAGGFGYDPVFFDTELGRSAAELSAAEKDARSHRGAALARLVRMLSEL